MNKNSHSKKSYTNKALGLEFEFFNILESSHGLLKPLEGESKEGEEPMLPRQSKAILFHELYSGTKSKDFR